MHACMHKTVHRGAHACLRVMGLKREGSRRVALSSSGVLEVKDDLVDKNGKDFMYWNVAPDVLPGSATNGPLALMAVFC